MERSKSVDEAANAAGVSLDLTTNECPLLAQLRAELMSARTEVNPDTYQIVCQHFLDTGHCQGGGEPGTVKCTLNGSHHQPEASVMFMVTGANA